MKPKKLLNKSKQPANQPKKRATKYVMMIEWPDDDNDGKFKKKKLLNQCRYLISSVFFSEKIFSRFSFLHTKKRHLKLFYLNQQPRMGRKNSIKISMREWEKSSSQC